MQKLMFLGLVFFVFFSIIPGSFAKETYNLQIDENEFEIIYDVDADIIAMAIDPELTSLLIGLENTKDSVFSIHFSEKMLNADNDEFAVLVNGLEVDYQILKNSDNFTLSFFIPSGTEEIEIIGTYVIPEFPLGPLFGFIIITSLVLVLSKFKSLRGNFINTV